MTNSETRSGWGWLLWLPGLLVALAAAAATAHGLYEVALAAGVPRGIAWLYPVITDGLALVAYVSTTKLTDHGARAYAWSVVVIAAGLSGLAQAAYLADGVATAATALRFGVGAWPAVAAAVVAHVLFLLGHRRDVEAAQDRPVTATDTERTVRAGGPVQSGVQPDLPTPAVQPGVQSGVQPADVQGSAVFDQSAVKAPPSRPSTPSRRGVGQREHARSVARRFARDERRLPTVTELQQRADVARGTASAALKELREHPHLHVVNDSDKEASQS